MVRTPLLLKVVSTIYGMIVIMMYSAILLTLIQPVTEPSDLGLPNNQSNLDSSSEDNTSGDIQANVDLGTFSTINPIVEKTMKLKIFNREYVDLSSLYFTKSNINETTTIHKTDHATITSTQKSANRKITNIFTWTRAFQIYADVYCSKYPQESSQMFTYMTLVQNLAQHNRNWLTYDEKFRQLRSVKPNIPWNTIHTETFLFCSISQPPATSSTFRPSTKSYQKFPAYIMQRKHYCWDFQQYGHCTKSACRVLHQCSNCEGQHGANRCNRPARRFITPGSQKQHNDQQTKSSQNQSTNK